jgi:predicted O-methyltransferase YrrM
MSLAKITSARHAAYWLRLDRWPEAGRRWLAGRRGHAWAKSLATDWQPSGLLSSTHAEDLAAASDRVAALGSPVGGAANLDLLYDFVAELRPQRVVETGVAAGWSSLAILLGLERTGGRLWSTDLPYPYLSGEGDWVGVAVPDRLRKNWDLRSGSDRERLPEVLADAGPIDLAHYDSDKSYAGALWGYRHLWDALRPGGVLVIDDVGDHLALRDFAADVGCTPTIVRDGTKFQGFMVRPA